MSEWNTLPIPLNRGLAQHEASNGFEMSSGLRTGVNVDFGTKGAVRGRPGWALKRNFYKRTLGVNGITGSALTVDMGSNLGPEPRLVEIADGGGSRPGLVTRGRIYVHDGVSWRDKGGACPMVVKQICRLGSLVQGGQTAHQTNLLNASYDFGPSIPSRPVYSLLDAEGRQTSVQSGSATPHRGMAARCGAVSALLTLNRPNLSIVLHTAGSSAITEAVIATDAEVGPDAGCYAAICCDFDATEFYVAYWIAAGGYKIKRISTAGAVLATSATIGTENVNAVNVQANLWITNTTVANAGLVVVKQTNNAGFGFASGVRSKVFNMTTLADLAIDITHTTEDPVNTGANAVCGVADGGTVWVIFNSHVAGDDGLSIHLRSYNIAATSLFFRRKWARYNINVPLNSNEAYGHASYVLHQPIRLGASGAPVLFGLSTTRGTPASTTITTEYAGATWSVHSIADLWFDGVATGSSNSGAIRDPVCVARGNLESSMPAWGPTTAILSADGLSYRFSSIEWDEFYRKADIVVTTGAHTAAFNVGTLGAKPVLTVNEVTLAEPSVAHFRGTTLLAGCSPRALAGGDCHPVGFPWADGPQITSCTFAGVAGTIAQGSYTLKAIWSWVDDAGLVHRSSPSDGVTVNIPAAATKTMTIQVQEPHFNEREFGTVKVELYSTAVNPTGNAALYLLQSFDYDPALAVVVFTVNSIPTDIATKQPLYTSGGVLSNQVPRADGGVTVTSTRAWMSDGRHLFASKLGDEQADNEAPAWHVDDTLRVLLPATPEYVRQLCHVGDEVVAWTSESIWVTSGDGPDDLGQGPDFRPAQERAKVGLVSARSLAWTPGGIVFQANHTMADGTPETGGLWLFDGQVQQISAPVRDDVGSATAGDVTYVPARDWVVWARPTKLLVYDRRVQQWAEWTPADIVTEEPEIGPPIEVVTPGNPVLSVTSASGLLWGLDVVDPFSLSGSRGQDVLVLSNWYGMEVSLGALAVAGDPGALGRCRSIQVVEDPRTDETPYDLHVTVVDSDGQTIGDGTHEAIVPEDAPEETFLSRQKCSAITVTLTANKAVPTWTGIVARTKGMVRNQKGSRTSE